MSLCKLKVLSSNIVFVSEVLHQKLIMVLDKTRSRPIAMKAMKAKKALPKTKAMKAKKAMKSMKPVRKVRN